MKKTYKIAIIPGDGIGPEVIAEGVKILKVIENQEENIHFDLDYFEWGSDFYKNNGRMMSENGIKVLSDYDAVYLGAVGDPDIPDHVTLWELLLKIRHEFDQYVNLRPIINLKGSPSVFVDSEKKIDMLFIRENTEGEYAGIGKIVNEGTEDEAAHQVSVFSKKGVERIIKYAYQVASDSNKSLTSITKSNALNYSMVYWDKKFKEIGKEYPNVKTYQYLVDAAAMHMITSPERFEVVVSSNLFGDILTDLGAAITGGMGLATGANINPEKSFPSMFEPIHGSAPDIANQGIANPIASIFSVGQMMTHLGIKEWEQRIIDVSEEILQEKKVLTKDLGGVSSTQEVGDAFVEKLSK